VKMSIYGESEACRYDKILEQPVYKYYVNKKLQSIKSWLNGTSVLLDVGCGTGVYATALASKHKTIVGSDISPQMVARGLSRAKRLGLDNIHFVVNDAANLPFRDDVFDLAYSVNLFHHMVDKKKIKNGFSEEIRCTKPTGHILVFELNPNSLGWSREVIPRIVRDFVYLLLFPLHQHVTDNIEDDTRMIGISELLDGLKNTKVVLRKIGGFIPTYCPKIIFKAFIILEKIMEANPLLNRYGAHVLIVGENS
jgi:ubiquinone/menaquinone biosynthesis C-methylase UbiE